MANRERWLNLLNSVEVNGRLDPVPDETLSTFEAVNKIKLPLSYREFCRVFGPGRLNGRIGINIAVPFQNMSENVQNAEHVKGSMESLNKHIWSTCFIDLDEYCSDPSLIRNGLFFGGDIYSHHYFWNKSECTNNASNELAIYVIYREWRIYRLADSFESFIFDICLNKGIPDHDKLDYDPPLFERV